MRHTISPIRHAVENILRVLGIQSRQSYFTPARNPESRRRFAAYMARVQPPTDVVAQRRTSRLLSVGGSMSRGFVHHAPESDGPSSRRPSFRFMSSAGEIATLRRARAESRIHLTPFRTLLNALRVR
ncbi:MAG: hypothetical protein IAE82_08445 [Opitutaceae bacterium]|nr:hypothetical protein [Opitutaceae bacterium]